KNVGVPFFEIGDNRNPIEIAQRATAEARTLLYDTVILDTAGRLHIDDELMQELEVIKGETRPSEILFVADAMTGQDAVKSAKEFDDRLGVTGIVLTKLDGDARGGAALSIKGVVNRPIKLVGIGEKSVVRMQAILDSMTKKERDFPQIIDGKRKKRIARGSGTTVQEINRLLKQYLQMKKMMRSFSKGFGARKFGKMMKGLPPELLQ